MSEFYKILNDYNAADEALQKQIDRSLHYGKRVFKVIESGGTEYTEICTLTIPPMSLLFVTAEYLVGHPTGIRIVDSSNNRVLAYGENETDWNAIHTYHFNMQLEKTVRIEVKTKSNAPKTAVYYKVLV